MSQRGRLAPYKAALEAISSRTRTPLSSLIVSFAILHELTAIAPLVSVFFLARSFGVGEHTVNFVRKEIPDGERDNDAWLREKGRKWIDEGEQWAGRVGRRYGILGFPKTVKGSESEMIITERTSNSLVGDVANAVFAYGVTKALLPARIGLSLYLAPVFSRSFVDPFRRVVFSRWTKKKVLIIVKGLALPPLLYQNTMCICDEMLISCTPSIVVDKECSIINLLKNVEI